MRKAETRVFYKYARLGLDRKNYSSVEMARRVSGYCSSDADAIRLLAVYDTLRVLEAEGKGECAEAVRAVYFSSRGKGPRKNDLTLAVRRFACTHFLDERTVWRRIDTAKSLYCSLVEEQLSCL